MFKEYNSFLNALKNYEKVINIINKINEYSELDFMINQSNDYLKSY